MEDCEQLLLYLVAEIKSNNKSSDSFVLRYQGNEISIKPPWERVSVSEAFNRWVHVDFEKFFDIKMARAVCKDKGYRVTPKNTLEELYNQIFLNEVEPHLGKNRPTILYDFPFYVAALCKLKDNDHRFAERFEFYIAGLELGDCYTELTDPVEQERRFQKELKKLKRLGKTEYDYDHDFIQALESGLPPSSGIAVGVDRLCMLFSDSRSISDTMFFPINDMIGNM